MGVAERVDRYAAVEVDVLLACRVDESAAAAADELERLTSVRAHDVPRIVRHHSAGHSAGTGNTQRPAGHVVAATRTHTFWGPPARRGADGVAGQSRSVIQQRRLQQLTEASAAVSGAYETGRGKCRGCGHGEPRRSRRCQRRSRGAVGDGKCEFAGTDCAYGRMRRTCVSVCACMWWLRTRVAGWMGYSARVSSDSSGVVERVVAYWYCSELPYRRPAAAAGCC